MRGGGVVDTQPMPELWSSTRIAGRMHREVFAPLGFERRGATSTRIDNRLERSIRFMAVPWSPGEVAFDVAVRLVGLPEKVTPHRCDYLAGTPKSAAGDDRYPRPRSADDLPADLVGDVSGPAVDFLLRAGTLEEFVEWAQEVFIGDVHRGCWGRFQPVFPQTTGPLEAATFAAALMGDTALTEQLALRVAEADAPYLADFQSELRHLGFDPV